MSKEYQIICLKLTFALRSLVNVFISCCMELEHYEYVAA